MKIQHTKETVHERSSWSKENAIDRRQLSQWGQVSTAQFRVAENGKLLGYSAACRVVTSLLCLYRCTGLIIRRWSGRFNTSNYGVVVNNTANTAKDILWTQLSKLNNESLSVPNSFQGTQTLQIFANLYFFYTYRWTINIFITNYYTKHPYNTYITFSYPLVPSNSNFHALCISIPLNSLIKRRDPNLRISSNEQSLLSKYLSAIVPSLISRCNLNRQEEDRSQGVGSSEVIFEAESDNRRGGWTGTSKGKTRGSRRASRGRIVSLIVARDDTVYRCALTRRRREARPRDKQQEAPSHPPLRR